jgi:hypothetical protein
MTLARNPNPLSIQRLHNDVGDAVGVGVGGRATVLKVTAALGGSLAGDADRSTTVGNTVGELVDGTSLVATSETLLVALTVDGNVLWRNQSVLLAWHATEQ